MLLCTETFRRPFVHLIFHFQDVLLSCVFFLLFSFELNLSCNAIILQHSVFYVCSIWKTHESKEKTSGAPALRNVQSHMKKKNVWNVVSHKLGINRSLFTKFSGIQFQRRVCIFIRLQQQMKFWFYDYVQNLHSAHTHTHPKYIWSYAIDLFWCSHSQRSDASLCAWFIEFWLATHSLGVIWLVARTNSCLASSSLVLEIRNIRKMKEINISVEQVEKKTEKIPNCNFT